MADEKIIKDAKHLDAEQLEKAAGGSDYTQMKCSECGKTALWAGFFRNSYDCPFCGKEGAFKSVGGLGSL